MVDVEDNIQKLVTEDENFEDPAILDVKKANKLDNFAFLNLHETPAYPKVATDLFGKSKDIWSINNFESVRSNDSKISDLKLNKNSFFMASGELNNNSTNFSSFNRVDNHDPILRLHHQHQNLNQVS